MLRSVRLENFRCYDFFDLASSKEIELYQQTPNWFHLIGSNGSGKTSILEAISLLAPGRGLRGAPPAEIRRLGATSGWRAHFQFTDSKILLQQTEGGRKSSGERGQAFWITPQSGVKFFTSKSERRACMNRWIGGLYPNYQKALQTWQRAYIQWSEACKNTLNEKVFRCFEEILEREAHTISLYRKRWLQELEFDFGLRGASLEMGECEQNWKEARRRGIAEGPHRSDLRLWARPHLSHETASTGEQKLMLVGLICSVARLYTCKNKILLLDDWSENFDEKNREAIRTHLSKMSDLIVWSSGVK